MNEDEGEPFDETMIDSVDRWSGFVFDALRDWPLAQAGRWTRCDDWLMLLIPAHPGETFGTIYVDSSEGRIRIDTGYWATPLEDAAGPPALAAAVMAEEARGLVERWIAGSLEVAVYFDADGKQCGHKILRGDDLASQLDPASINRREAVEAEVRTSRRAEWRRFAVAGGEVAEIVCGGGRMKATPSRSG
jgi:hypothetical protein